jgi:hypothetical protein
MARHAFTLTERWAVFEAHGSNQGTRCWLCSEPLNFVDMAVDHVIPEYLIENEAKLKEVLLLFGLSSDFDLNSFENWLPAHNPCNRQKHDHIFRPTPFIQRYIDRARDKAPKAREIYNRTAKEKQISKAIGTLTTGETRLPEHLLYQIVQHYASSNSEQIQVDTKIVGYVPPSEVRLAPDLTITFDPAQRPEANGPFIYSVQAMDFTTGSPEFGRPALGTDRSD